MKKFLSVIMAVAMIFAMAIPAFAATITINGDATREYVGYQLLKLTTSLKDNTCHADGAAHDDNCYNYAYTVNEKYRTILQQEVKAHGNTGAADASAIADEQIVTYFGDLDADGMREAADRIYRAIKADTTITADAQDITGGTSKTVDQGYWMFADVTELDGNKANSLVMVDTAGQETITITPKVELPTVEKKVKDINNSEDGSIADNAWQDAADHDINDVVPFKLTATLPANVSSYQSYKIVFHDSMSAGLTFDSQSVSVHMYENKAAADAALTANGTEVTTNFVLATEDLATGETFTLTCNDVLALGDVTKDTVFVVYYEATLNGNAVIGAGGNPNEVYLEFSNNPYEEGTGKTEKDKVIVFTYQLKINKVDEAGDPLTGAGFTLYKKNLAGEYTAIGSELKGDTLTTFTWTGLDDGDYKLVESTVPDGYNKMADVEFSIGAVHSVEAADPALESLTGDLGTGDVNTGIIEEDIVNNTGTILPETGAMGTFLLICGGATLVLVAAVFMITRKKMSVFED
jgi:fimbrial isopeptide formation D2 family protein